MSKSFRRNTHFLKDVGPEFSQGELAALIGASGSGKSTFSRLVAGMEQVDGGAGLITILGEPTQTGITYTIFRTFAERGGSDQTD